MATVVGLFEDRESAQNAVQQLRDMNVPAGKISVAMRQSGDVTTSYEGNVTEADADSGAGGAITGAVGGGVLGGLAGLLVGVGALAVPGIGPIAAAGPLATTLAGAGIGAAAGGLVGALVDAGVPEEEAEVYHRGVERGGVLVTAQVADGQEGAAQEILNRSGARDASDDASNLYSDPNFSYGSGGQASASTSAVAENDDATTHSHGTSGAGTEAAGGGAGALAGGVAGAVIGGPVGAGVGAALGGLAGASAAGAAKGDDAGEEVGTGAGGATGAVAGGIIGAVGGPIGAAAGAAIGGAAGGALGKGISDEAADATDGDANTADTGYSSTADTSQYNRTETYPSESGSIGSSETVLGTPRDTTSDFESSGSVDDYGSGTGRRTQDVGTQPADAGDLASDLTSDGDTFTTNDNPNRWDAERSSTSGDFGSTTDSYSASDSDAVGGYTSEGNLNSEPGDEFNNGSNQNRDSLRG